MLIAETFGLDQRDHWALGTQHLFDNENQIYGSGNLDPRHILFVGNKYKKSYIV